MHDGKREPVNLARRKMITLKELPIGKFMKEYYISALEKKIRTSRALSFYWPLHASLDNQTNTWITQ